MTITQVTTPPASGIIGRTRGFRHRLSSRAHATGDLLASRSGWQITSSTSRLGLSGRTYRDPRFGPESGFR